MFLESRHSIRHVAGLWLPVSGMLMVFLLVVVTGSNVLVILYARWVSFDQGLISCSSLLLAAYAARLLKEVSRT